MGVVRTDKWLRLYCEKWSKAETMEDKLHLQRQILINPLCDVIKGKDPDYLQHYLFQAGLSQPDVLGFELQTWHDHQFWSQVQNQLTYLREKWAGPDVKVYLLPIEKRNKFIMKELGGKMGITLPQVIILFIHTEIKMNDLLALITHEYHHVCRLSHTNHSEQSIPLLESIVMEGLAEYAVKEELGADVNAKWTKYYDHNWKMKWFEKWIRPNLLLTDRNNHHMYLYGDDQKGIPLWLGYYTGYRLVDSATKSEDTTYSLLRVPAKTLLERSSLVQSKKKGGSVE